MSVCDNAAYGTGIMSQMSSDTGNCRSLHLEIGDFQVIESEGFKGIEHIRHRQWHSDDTSLRTVETGSGNRHSRHGAITEKSRHLITSFHEIRIRKMSIPASMLLECSFNICQGNLITVGIPVEQSVAAHGNVREDKCTKRNLRLDGPGCTDADDIERTMFRLDLACLEVDIGQSIKLVHNDIDIVRTDTGRQSRNPDSLIFSSH